jgi:hypothetical protein
MRREDCTDSRVVHALWGSAIETEEGVEKEKEILYTRRKGRKQQCV